MPRHPWPGPRTVDAVTAGSARPQLLVFSPEGLEAPHGVGHLGAGPHACVFPSVAAPVPQCLQTLQGGRVEAVRQGGRRGHRDGEWAQTGQQEVGAPPLLVHMVAPHEGPAVVPSRGSLGLWGTLAPVFLQDKTLKCTVYRVRGSVSASNYIQLPRTGTQSLGLTGRYLYVLFRPLPPRHFVIHLDVFTEVPSSGPGAARGGPALLPSSLAFSPLSSVPAGQPGHPRVLLQPLQGVQVHGHVASVPFHL